MRLIVPKLLALVSSMMVVLAAAVPSVSAQSAWQQGPGAILDNTYDGTVDAPQNGATLAANGSFGVIGWFVDKQAQGWAGADDIEVWLGTMDGGGHMLARANIAQSRPDVATAEGNPYFAASGFFASVAGSSVPSGSQTLYVYVHTGGKGWWFKTVNVTGGGSGAAPAPSASGAPASSSGGAPVLTFNTPTAGQNVSTKSDFTITGTVNNPGTIDRIEVWINGERNSATGALLGTTTPASDGSWSVTFTPTHFPSTHANLYAYAHNRAGQETEAVVDMNIVDK